VRRKEEKGKDSFHLAYFQTKLCYFYARITQVRGDFESLAHTMLGLSKLLGNSRSVCVRV